MTSPILFCLAIPKLIVVAGSIFLGMIRSRLTGKNIRGKVSFTSAPYSETLKKLSLGLAKSFEEDEDDQTLKTKLLDKRNQNWIPKINAVIQNKSCFIAIGAGHLVGENGLINLLKNQGYTVEPISIN